MKDSNIQLKQYFLGNLDEKSSDDISLQIIENPEFENELRVAENELMEDFLERQLSSEEEKLFYTNFLICEDRVNDLKQLSLLKNYSKKISQAKNSNHQATTSTIGFWEKIKTLFSENFRPATAIITLIMILLLGGIIWFYVAKAINQPTKLEQEYAHLNQKDLSNLNEYSNYTNINLNSVTLRDATNLPKLNTNNSTENIFFRLPLPFVMTEKDLLNVEILSDQKTIFTQKNIQIYKNQAGQDVRLILPKSIFQKGQFQIKIQNPDSNFVPIYYTFAVEYYFR